MTFFSTAMPLCNCWPSKITILNNNTNLSQNTPGTDIWITKLLQRTQTKLGGWKFHLHHTLGVQSKMFDETAKHNKDMEVLL